MTAFDDFLKNANSQAADIMGELVEIDGHIVRGIFDEETNAWDMNDVAEQSTPTVTLVLPLSKLIFIPKKKTRFIRQATSEKYFITEVKLSTGNVELTATNETRRDV